MGKEVSLYWFMPNRTLQSFQAEYTDARDFGGLLTAAGLTLMALNGVIAQGVKKEPRGLFKEMAFRSSMIGTVASFVTGGFGYSLVRWGERELAKVNTELERRGIYE